MTNTTYIKITFPTRLSARMFADVSAKDFAFRPVRDGCIVRMQTRDEDEAQRGAEWIARAFSLSYYRATSCERSNTYPA